VIKEWEERPAPYKDGWYAGKDGASITDCPYDLRLQKQSAYEWEQGWKAHAAKVRAEERRKAR
jgi:ribosome modulation factor